MKVNPGRIAEQIRHYVEIECLTDREIALKLQVATSTVNHWRRRAKISYAQSWRRRFERTYAQRGGLAKLRWLVRQGAGPTEISMQFGFSREYGRQIKAKVLRHGG